MPNAERRGLLLKTYLFLPPKKTHLQTAQSQMANTAISARKAAHLLGVGGSSIVMDTYRHCRPLNL